ncbi:MAG: CocE/NonD family hydrolase, partial [Rhodoferax sp.]
MENNNGKVGQYGTSYPGFYTAVGILADHPALVASSPQAPISNFW